MFEPRLTIVHNGQSDAETLADLARDALSEGEEERALPYLSRAAAIRSDARLWQWTGLLFRSLDEHDDALRAFENAAHFAPSDPSIAHGYARIALEAGLHAVPLFERARQFAPANGDVLVGLAAARAAAGQGEAAAAELDAILLRAPLWIQGHIQLAQLRSVLGQGNAADASFRRALRMRPSDETLWKSLFDLHLQAERYSALKQSLAEGEKAGLTQHLLAEYKAIAFSETGDMALAERAFQSVSLFSASQSMIWRIRHHLRYGALDKASALIEEGLKGEQSAAIWPYASIAWRLTADARADWLDAHGALVSVLDIREDLPPLDQLRNHLRGLHRAKGEYLDQSVRGGTQTDGPLLSRIEPEIRTTREAILKAVRKYVSELSPIDPAHPLLGHRRDRRPRFAGSWSVRLRGEGHHANHVHPQGWISSALYISLPERTGGSGDETAGWLTLGKPQESLGIDLPATRLIEPREGQLVLFPSWMWHGTLPFPEGERLTIAFDVAPPR